MKNKLLSLLICTSLLFVGCSPNVVDNNDNISIVTDVIDSRIIDSTDLDDVDIIDEFDEFDNQDKLDNQEETDLLTDSADTDNNNTTVVGEVVGVGVGLDQTQLVGTDNNSSDTSFTDEVIEPNDGVVVVEPVIEVLEAYAENEDSGYVLKYNLTGNLDIESHVFEQVNDLRESLGIAPLTTNNRLVDAAFIRAMELPTLFSHTRPSGEQWFTVFQEIPYDVKNCGENLTTGSGLTREQAYNKIFESWYNSPGHYENMVNPEFKEIGISVFIDFDGSYYASQIFGSKF